MTTQLLLTLWAAAAAAWDWRTRRLPNALTLGALGLAALWLALAPAGPLGASRGEGLLALVAALVLLLPGYRAGLLGAGDVKLAAAMALLRGPRLPMLPALETLPPLPADLAAAARVQL